jgi:hypothetical protein
MVWQHYGAAPNPRWTDYGNSKSGGKDGWWWPPSQQPPQHRIPGAEWTCSICRIVNPTTKKERCQKCGIKRAVGEKSPPPVSQLVDQPKPTLTYAQAVQYVAAAQATPTSPVQAAPAVVQVAPEVKSPKKQAAEDTKLAKSRIVKYTSQLESLEAEDIDMRALLLGKIESIKATIVDAKPIGQRIDDTRNFLERAQARGKSAALALLAAEEAVVAATTEIDRATAELQELEAALAHAPEPCTDAPSSGTTQELSQVLSALLAHMKADPLVDPSLIRLAQAHSSQLLNGFQHTIAAMQAAQAESPPPFRRKVGKQPRIPPAAAVGPARKVKTRMAGKRAASTLGQFFVKRVATMSSPQTTPGAAVVSPPVFPSPTPPTSQ